MLHRFRSKRDDPRADGEPWWSVRNDGQLCVMRELLAVQKDSLAGGFERLSFITKVFDAAIQCENEIFARTNDSGIPYDLKRLRSSYLFVWGALCPLFECKPATETGKGAPPHAKIRRRGRALKEYLEGRVIPDTRKSLRAGDLSIYLNEMSPAIIQRIVSTPFTRFVNGKHGRYFTLRDLNLFGKELRHGSFYFEKPYQLLCVLRESCAEATRQVRNMVVNARLENGPPTDLVGLKAQDLVRRLPPLPPVLPFPYFGQGSDIG